MGSKGPRKMQVLIPELNEENKPITFKPINVNYFITIFNLKYYNNFISFI